MVVEEDVWLGLHAIRARNVDLDQNIANPRPTIVKMARSTLGVA